MKSDVVFQWLGTAGFRIEHFGKVVLIDPFFSRNEDSTPILDLKPADMSDADHIFVSHGHFDHIVDVSEIVGLSSADVWCSRVAADALVKMGVPGGKINSLSGGESIDLDTFTVDVVPTRHIRFDARLVLSTIPGILRERKLVKGLSHYQSGTVMIYRFDFGGLRVVHIGSLGLEPGDVTKLGLNEPKPDMLLLPVQGHTDICRRAALVTAAIHPRAVVPQHHDNFFPPISRVIDIEPFCKMVAEMVPDCAYFEPVLSEKFTAAEVLEGD